MEHEFKVGDMVRITGYPGYNKSYYGHKIGDIGKVSETRGNDIFIIVEGRISTSCEKPAVSHKSQYLELVSADSIINNYQIY